MPPPSAIPAFRRRLSFPLLLALGAGLSVFSVPLACSLGALGIDALDVLRVFSGALSGAGELAPGMAVSPEGLARSVDGPTLRLIVMDLRLPRVILAYLAGGGLAVAGAVFQAVLRNPLADPFTLGVSGGAAFGAALAISLGCTGIFFGFGLPVFAFVGAGAALAAVLILGRVGGGLRHETLILAGVVVSAFLAALIALVKALDEASVTGIVFWIMGSFQGRGGADLLLALPGLVLGCGLAMLLTRELDMLSLGDGAARGLGLDTAGMRLVLLLAAGLVTASCVAVSGIIGFVGLIVPHLARMLLGAAHRFVMPAGFLAGGLLLLWSDTAARTVLPGGVEMPVGIITALLGGPFFCFVLGKKQGRGRAGPGTLFEAAPPELGDADGASERERAGPRPSCSGRVAASCDGVAFAYGGRGPHALEDITLRLREGEFAALLGPNGSGKSTLLRCLSGQLSPGRGTVLVQGRDMSGLREKERARLAALLPQSPESVPALTAFSLALMGRYAHTPFLGAYGASDRRVTARSLAECEAAHLVMRPATGLSGGELQRVLLARALAQQSPLLLLDEATSGLDPSCRTLVLEALARRNREHGLTILAAMHDLNLAARYCRRLIFLKQGRIVADGPTESVFTAETLREVFETDMTILAHPTDGKAQALPA